jgi:hypothetical protein
MVKPNITDLEYDFLSACQEAVIRQQELVPLLARQLDLQPEDVIFNWLKHKPGNNQLGMITGTDWRYFFHGLECDLKNIRDGRFLRLDFGPNGRYDTFSGYGILQFVMTTRFPWREFEALKLHLSDAPGPFTEYSGSHQRMNHILDHLLDFKLVKVADQDLCAIEKEHRQKYSGKLEFVPLEPDDPYTTQVMSGNTHYCFNLVLSESGMLLLRNGHS